jgi:hypothetical protein
MTFPSLLLRRYATAIGIILVGLLVLWGVLWTFASAQFNSLIDAWLQSEKAKGGAVTYTKRSSGGFPGAVVVSFTDLNWRTAGGHAAKVQNLVLRAHPWGWRTIDMTFDGPTEAAVPYPNANDPLLITGNLGGGRLNLNVENVADNMQATLRDAHVRRPSRELFTAAELRLAASYPDQPPQNHQDTGLTVTTGARDVTLVSSEPLPLGQQVAMIDVTMRVMGKVPDPYNRSSVAAWNSNSGVVEFDQFRLDWGAMQLNVKGTLALDDDLQPEGAFSGQIAGHEELVGALLEQQWIAPRQAGMLNSALKLFAKPGQLIGARQSIEVPITVQLGGLFFGPVRIFTFPEITWPQQDPAAAPPEPAAPPVSPG